MSSYVFVFRHAMKPGSPQELEAQLQRWGAWFAALKAKGQPAGGDALEPAGAVVGKSGVTPLDRAFPEAKDLVGGFTMIEAETLEGAIALARDCPALDHGGSVEVRPVLDTSSYG